MTLDLYTSQRELTEAVTNALMRRSADYIVGGSCAEGRFEYIGPRVTINDQAESFYITYPDGEWMQGNGLLGKDGPADYVPYDVKQVWADLAAAVESWLKPFFDMPTPDSFDGDIATLQEVAADLRAGGDVTLSGSAEKITVETGNDVVDAYITVIEDELTDLNGVAMKALRDYYGNRIRNTLTGQHAFAVVAGTLVAGEKAAWEQVEKDLATLLQQTIGAFNQFAEGSTPGWTDVIGVLKSVSDAAGLFGIPLGLAGKAIGKAATVTSLVAPFMPEAPEPQEFSIKGGSFDELWESFTTSMQNLDVDLTRAEEAFATCAQRASEAYVAHPQAFNLRRPGDFLGADPSNDDVYRIEAGGRDDVIKVNDALKTIAARFDLVGDYQDGLAGRLGGAFQHGYSPAAPRYAQAGPIWERQGWGGAPLGWSWTGHYPEYSAFLESLIGLLKSEAVEAHRVAEQCLLVLSDFRATEGQIEQRLDRQSERVEREVESQL